MIRLDLITNFLTLIVDFLILGFAIYRYFQLRLKNLKYFIGAFTFLFVGDLSVNIASRLGYNNYGLNGLGLAVSTMASAFGLYLLLLFIETFKSEFPFRKRIATLGFILFICLSIFAVFSFKVLIIAKEYSISGGIFNIIDENSVDQLPIGSQLDFLAFFILLGVLNLLTFIVLISCIRKLFKIKKQTNNPKFKAVLKKMEIGILIIIFGVVFSFFIENTNYILSFINDFISLSGFFLIFWTYLRKGIHVIQGDHLEMFLIINKAGLPLFSHQFTQDTSNFEDAVPKDQEDLLISGALQAISTLLTQITGFNENVREIHMDHSVLMLDRANDNEHIVILLVDQSTKFYRNVLKQITEHIFHHIKEIPRDQKLTNENEKIVKKSLQEFLGA